MEFYKIMRSIERMDCHSLFLRVRESVVYRTMSGEVVEVQLQCLKDS